MIISKIKEWWVSLWKKESKLKGLFLDDERNPQDVTWVKYPKHVEWVVVRSYDEFFYEFHRGQFQVISFDHDIQDYNRHGVEMTGYTVLKAMIDYLIDNEESCRMPEQVFFHTQNPIGKVNMKSYWDSFCKHCKEENE